MGVVKFKLWDSRSSSFFFKVYVYDDLRKMRKDAIKYNEGQGTVKDNDGDMLGITHMYEHIRIDVETGKEFQKCDVGIIRLAKKHATGSIVAHEIIHAALWIYRLEFGNEREWEGSSNNADFGNGNTEDEEKFAYLYGHLFRNMTIKLYKHKIWGK